MDSGHSGSIQSSSGNEDEFDSRAFNPQQQFPFANNLQMPNFNAPWSIARSEPNSNIHSFVPQQTQPGFTARVGENNHLVMQQGSTGTQGATRNPKKRSRASRRAPTTVLNTDTSNFRAMVQQFTGVPSTPFTDQNNVNINMNKRSRLSDLFANASNAYSPPYVLRPFAQKPTPLASSSLNNNNSLLPTIHTTDQEAARKFSSSVFDVQNPIGNGMNSLVFQNNPSFQLPNNDQLQSGSSSLFRRSYNNMMIPTSNEDVHHYYNSSDLAKLGGLSDHQFGLTSHGVNENVGLPNLVSSERNDNRQNEGVDNNNNRYKFDNRNDDVEGGEEVE